jgi:DNA polymerase III alpha subunit
VTIEHETGCVNVVVWRALADRQRRELLASRLMGIAGTIEREGEVVHLVAGRLFDHTLLMGRLVKRSRDSQYMAVEESDRDEERPLRRQASSVARKASHGEHSVRWEASTTKKIVRAR